MPFTHAVELSRGNFQKKYKNNDVEICQNTCARVEIKIFCGTMQGVTQ